MTVLGDSQNESRCVQIDKESQVTLLEGNKAGGNSRPGGCNKSTQGRSEYKVKKCTSCLHSWID